MGDSRVSRRTLLGAAVATAAAAGMSSGLGACVATPATPPAQTQTQIEPLTPVLELQQRLQDLYTRLLGAFPELLGALTDFQAQTTAHTTALFAAAPAAAAQIATANASTTSSTATSGPTSAGTSSSNATPAPPGDAATGLMDLRQAVASSAQSLGTAALQAEGDLAALLGSCAASTTCHGRMLA